MIEHLDLKNLHLSCAALSLAGFFIRGVMMVRGSGLVWNRWVRTLPHFVDSLLLITGIWMAVNLTLTATGAPWLIAKIIALFGYVVLGAIALRYGKTRNIRIGAFVAALTTFAYIASVAATRSPLLGL